MPVPVTVIRVGPVAVVRVLACAPVDWAPDCVPDDDGAALPAVVPSANAPIKMAAATPPKASARWLGVRVTMPM